MQESVGPEPAAVVAGSDAETYTILSGRLDAGVVILCDHAGNAFPPGYGTLGLAASELERHIAYDVGAAVVTRRLAAALGAPAVLTRYSRLLIDVNRGLDDPTLIMRLSDGAIVTGNRQLDAAERDQRIRLYYEPYHAAIEGLIEPLARRRLVGQGSEAGPAIARGSRGRAGAGRGRERALLRPPQGRLDVAARDHAPPRPCHRRDPAGFDPRPARPTGVGRAARRRAAPASWARACQARARFRAPLLFGR